MKTAEMPANEQERIEALKRYKILDTAAEQEFEDIVLLASTICQTPISLVTLVDTDRQWFKSKVGLDVPQTSRDVAFCSHVILEKDLMVVSNALEDERFYDNPLVLNDPNIRFYAGVPLITHAGYSLGTLCVIDREPRSLDPQQQFALRVLGKNAMNMIELRLRNELLAELNNMQNKFLSIISHDVKNPLYSLDALVGMFRENDVSKEQFVELTGESQKQIRLTLTLLDDLMQWSASGITSGELHLAPVDLRIVTAETIEVLDGAARAKQITLQNEVPAQIMIMAEENMIRFVLRNLLTNAVKFTPAGGRVTVAAANTASGWEVKVSDTGVGMSAQLMARLFNWKNRTSTMGTQNERGTGLGLLLCQEFVNKHKGKISISSTPGKGSTFTFTINTI